MARQKGDGRGRMGGRKAGSQNKITKEGQAIFQAIVEQNQEKAMRMMDMIVEPEKWMQLYIRCAEFVYPKKAAVTVNGSVKQSDLKSEIAELAKREID